MRCQRYYYEVTSANTDSNVNQSGVVIASSSTSCEYLPIFPVPMRANPSASLTADIGIMRADGGSSIIDVSIGGSSFVTLPQNNGFSGHMWLNRVSGTGFTTGLAGRLCTGDPAGKITFSAEL